MKNNLKIEDVYLKTGKVLSVSDGIANIDQLKNVSSWSWENIKFVNSNLFGIFLNLNINFIKTLIKNIIIFLIIFYLIIIGFNLILLTDFLIISKVDNFYSTSNLNLNTYKNFYMYSSLEVDNNYRSLIERDNNNSIISHDHNVNVVAHAPQGESVQNLDQNNDQEEKESFIKKIFNWFYDNITSPLNNFFNGLLNNLDFTFYYYTNCNYPQNRNDVDGILPSADSSSSIIEDENISESDSDSEIFEPCRLAKTREKYFRI